VSGKLRDPLVGRDVLYAVLFGMLYALFILAYEFWLMRTTSGFPAGDGSLQMLMGLRPFSLQVSQNLFYGITNALEFFLMLFLFRALVRKPWIAALLLVALFVSIKAAPSDNHGPVTWIFWTAIYGILVFLMLRFGMFALILTMFVINCTVECYFTTDFRAWYGQSSLALVLLLCALAVWGFRVSLGGRPLFSAAALEKT
jgi:hypothetical protein